METNVERRRHKRIDKMLPLKLREGDFDLITETRNISTYGAYCEVTRYLPPLTKVNVNLVFPKTDGTSETIACQGIVVRVDHMPTSNGTNHYCIALYFSQINKDDASKLNAYVESQSVNLN